MPLSQENGRTGFGAKLRAARTAAGLSQHELAIAASASSLIEISRYERGLHMPKPDRLAALAAALNVSVEQLVGVESTGQAA
jgi:transcriptional regulator with XRE-family HTH domain